MGGIEAQVSRLAGRQAAAGDDVEVITAAADASRRYGVTTSVEHHAGGDVVVHRVAARIPGGLPVHPRSTRHVVDRLRFLCASGRRPDVVHLHMGVLAPTVQAALGPITRLGLPLVLTVHSVWGAAWRAFAAADALADWSRWPVLWTGVSELTAAPLRRVVAERGTVAILPNGLDLDRWRVARADAERPGSPAPVHVVSAARFAPRKRMIPLLRAIATVCEELPEPERDSLRVTLAGSGTEWERARRFVDARGLSSVVDLTGALDGEALRGLYGSADVFVAPAVAEAFGIAALEAQAAGLVVLTRAGSGVAERLTDGVDGLIAPDDAGLTRALIRLTSEPGFLARLLDATRSTAHRSSLASYDWPNVLAATHDLYESAATLVSPR